MKKLESIREEIHSFGTSKRIPIKKIKAVSNLKVYFECVYDHDQNDSLQRNLGAGFEFDYLSQLHLRLVVLVVQLLQLNLDIYIDRSIYKYIYIN